MADITTECAKGYGWKFAFVFSAKKQKWCNVFKNLHPKHKSVWLTLLRKPTHKCI